MRSTDNNAERNVTQRAVNPSTAHGGGGDHLVGNHRQSTTAAPPPHRRQGKRRRTLLSTPRIIAAVALVIAALIGAAIFWSPRTHPATTAASSLSTPPPPVTVPHTSFTLAHRPTHNLVGRDSTTHTPPNAPAQQTMWPALARRVVVIGGGLAGQSATIEAAARGAHVLLLEKEAKLGGNSAKATSGINGWGTRAQLEQGIDDSGKFFERDTFRSGAGGNCDPGLVKMLSVKSADAIKWLSGLGVPLTVLSQLGGASRKRCHRAPDQKDGTPVPIGFTIMRILENHIRSNLHEKVTVMTGSELLRLLYTEEMATDGTTVRRVNGVEYLQQDGDAVDPKTIQVEADAVILATGGFSNDHTTRSLLDEYAPQLASFPTTNGPWATGDGVKMARMLGAALVDMDKVQLHPTGLINPKEPCAKTVFLGPEALRGSGGVLLNNSGERFVNELDLRSVVSQAIIAQGNEYPESGGRKFAYCVLNENAAKLFGSGSLGFYWKRMGLFTKVENVAELAKLIGCDQDTLHSTLDTYEHLSSGKTTCPLTGKIVFPCVLGPQGPFYVAYVTPSIHYTMGGCLISPSAEVQSATPLPFGSRRPILGLFGAGEVTGGVHGGNRLGGNSLLECVVFGKIAGRRAAQSCGDEPYAFVAGSEEWVTATVREVLPERADESGAAIGRQVVLSLPSGRQRSGLELLQPILLRGHSGGQTRTAQLIPSTTPSELGAVAVFLPAPPLMNATDAWLYQLQAGDDLSVRAAGKPADDGLLRGPRRLHVIAAAPHGVAPLLQLVRASLEEPLRSQLTGGVHLLYTADSSLDLSYRSILEGCRDAAPGHLHCTLLLQDPPAKWTGGVGAMDEDTLRTALPPPGSSPAGEDVIAVAGLAVHTSPIIDFLNREGYAATAKIIQLPL